MARRKSRTSRVSRRGKRSRTSRVSRRGKRSRTSRVSRRGKRSRTSRIQRRGKRSRTSRVQKRSRKNTQQNGGNPDSISDVVYENIANELYFREKEYPIHESQMEMVVRAFRTAVKDYLEFSGPPYPPDDDYIYIHHSVNNALKELTREGVPVPDVPKVSFKLVANTLGEAHQFKTVEIRGSQAEDIGVGYFRDEYGQSQTLD